MSVGGADGLDLVLVESGAPEDADEQIGLALDVRPDVLNLVGEAELQCSIRVPQHLVRPQCVSDGQVVAEGKRAVDDDIDVAAGGTAGRTHGVAVQDPEVAAVLISDCRQGRDGLVKVIATHDDVDVDLGLRRQPGHGGAADVRDPADWHPPERFRKLGLDLRERRSPHRIVRNDLDRHGSMMAGPGHWVG